MELREVWLCHTFEIAHVVSGGLRVMFEHACDYGDFTRTVFPLKSD
jgi:hypothetical protein